MLNKQPFNEGDKIKITTRVVNDSIKYETSQLVKILGFRIYLPLVPEIYFGDIITVIGVVSDGKLKSPTLIKIENNEWSIFNVKNKIVSLYAQTLPEPLGGLMAGITLGSKGALSQDLYQKTKNVGLTHVVVASGTNVTLVTAFLISTLTVFFKRGKTTLFVILGNILYLFISGFDAPLVRASIMSATLLTAEGLGRVVSGWRVLVLTGILMLLISPLYISDLGFILSFVSTASLMLFERKIKSRIKLVPEFFKEGLSTSLAAQIGVTPILFVTFGQFNILSPFINALVLWTVPLIMVFGSIGGLIGLVFPFLGKIIIYLSYPLLWYFNFIVTLFN